MVILFRRTQQKYLILNAKCPTFFFPDFNKIWIFWTDFRNKCPVSVRWQPGRFSRREGRTEMTELIGAFHN